MTTDAQMCDAIARTLARAEGHEQPAAVHYAQADAVVAGHLSPLLAERDEANEHADNAEGEAVLRQATLQGMTVEEGAAVLKLGPPRELVIAWVDAARKMLGNAENYSETRIDFPRESFSMDVKAAGEFDHYVFTVQRAGKLTPHEARKQAEAERDEAREAYEAEVGSHGETVQRVVELSKMLRGMARRVREVRDGVRGPWHPNWHAAWKREQSQVADLRARLARAEQEAAELRESRFAWAFEADRLETVRRKAVGEWMDTDRDHRRLRAEVVGDLHALADRDEVTTGDIHSLADEIEGAGWLGNQPAEPDQTIPSSPALRARVQTDEWCHAEPRPVTGLSDLASRTPLPYDEWRPFHKIATGRDPGPEPAPAAEQASDEPAFFANVAPHRQPGEDWCNCQAVPGTPIWPGPWHPIGNTGGVCAHHPAPAAQPPTLAETRTGTDWCPNCCQEAGTDRYRDDGGTERCATCGSELESAPAAPPEPPGGPRWEVGDQVEYRVRGDDWLVGVVTDAETGPFGRSMLVAFNSTGQLWQVPQKACRRVSDTKEDDRG